MGVTQIYTLAEQFGVKISTLCPERIIYGYARLISTDETQIKNLVSDTNMKDLDAAHRWFSNNRLDFALIKSGLLLLMPIVEKSDVLVSKAQQFKVFISNNDNPASDKILDEALKLSTIDFTGKFSTGNNMNDIFEYQSELKKSFGSTNKSNSKIGHAESDGRQNTAASDDGSGLEDAQSLTDLIERYKKLSSALLDVVKGQDQAILRFLQGYNQGELLKDSSKRNRPRSYFFFFGPPGVGKTLMAETVAESLDLPYKKFNMSEYSTNQSHEELIGISDMYKNAKEGILVKFVRENPRCILLFDEIEKAHINVIKLFLQILDSGTMHNSYRDNDVSFKDTTIIFTSNVGKKLYEDRSVNLTTLPVKVLVNSIQNEKDDLGKPVFPPEMCSRIASGNTILFNHLSVRHLAEMVRNNFDKIVRGMSEQYGVRITYSNYLPLLFLYNMGGGLDARVATGQSSRFLKDEIYELMRQISKSDVSGKLSTIHIDIDWDNMDPELMRLFKNEDTAEILLFMSDKFGIADRLTSDGYKVHMVNTVEDALKAVKHDISAVYIDPFYGEVRSSDGILSIADYNTEGIRLFHELVEKHMNLPVYMIETGEPFSDVDKHTFIQEGAAGTAALKVEQIDSFRRQFAQTQEELYMEKESQVFSQRGWVIDFNTKQELSGDTANIYFYNLKKRLAVDVESRGSILSDIERPNVKFDDVIGAESAKADLKYFVGYLKNPKHYIMEGGSAPKGVLLYGPPGTGKTMLARAMAGESDVTFIQTSAAEFKNKYVGESEANIKRIFEKARKYAPSIVFIDEIDAIGKKRTGSEFAGTTESMLNALLTQMDGFAGKDPNRPVFVLAATNYGVGGETDGIASLDEALIRRFDNKIYVDLPKESERKQYLEIMCKKKKMAGVSDSAIENIAERTTGQSLAVLANVCDTAFRRASREFRSVTDDDMFTALEEYNYGEKKEHSPEYYRNVAIHETGHAYVSYISGDKPSYITIESRGNFGGYMQHANQEKAENYTMEQLIGRIRTALAGRAAEMVFCGKTKAVNTGASSDLKTATDLAFKIICTFGMDDSQLVVLDYDTVMKSSMASDYVARMNDILKTEMKNTMDIIEKGRDKIELIAGILARENKLTGRQFEKLMECNDLAYEGQNVD